MDSVAKTTRWISLDWKWIVAMSAFWVNFCILGVMRSSAVVYVGLLEYFSIRREEAAWFMGVFGFCMCITGVLSGYLNQYYSIRRIMMVGAVTASVAVCASSFATSVSHVTVLYGAFQGAGIGMIVPLTHVILNQHFTNHRALAMGIAYSGSSVGSFLFPPLAHWIINEFGFPGLFLLLGGIMLNSLPAIALMKAPRERLEKNRDSAPVSKLQHENMEIRSEENKHASVPKHIHLYYSKPNKVYLADGIKTDTSTVDSGVTSKCGILRRCPSMLRARMAMTLEVLSNPCFLVISAAYAVYFSISSIYLTIILDFAIGIGISDRHGVYLVSVFSFGDLAGRLAFGWIADMNFVRRNVIVWCYLLAMGGLVVAVPWCHSFCLLTIVSVLLGLLNGSVMVNFSPMMTECMGLQKLPIAMGFASFIIGSTAFLRPVVIGAFRDKNQSYNFMFVVLGAVQMLTAMPLIFQEFKHLIRTSFSCMKHVENK